MSLFRPLQLLAQTPWPGTPPRPTRILDPLGQEIAPSEPINTLINPRWYYRWLRTVVEGAWVRLFHVPAGASTVISRDSCSMDSVMAAQWGVFISTPDSRELTIEVYSARDTSYIRPDPRGVQLYTDPTCVDTCRIQVWPVLDPQGAELKATWSLSQGSVLFDSGHEFYRLVNSGAQAQSLIVLSSRQRADIERVLKDPKTLIKPA